MPRASLLSEPISVSLIAVGAVSPAVLGYCRNEKRWLTLYVARSDRELVEAAAASDVAGLLIERQAGSPSLDESFPTLGRLLARVPSLVLLDGAPSLCREVLDLVHSSCNVVLHLGTGANVDPGTFTQSLRHIGKSAARELISAALPHFTGSRRRLLIGMGAACTAHVTTDDLSQFFRCSRRSIERSLRAADLLTCNSLLKWSACIQFVWLCDGMGYRPREAAEALGLTQQDLRRHFRARASISTSQAIDLGHRELVRLFSDALREGELPYRAPVVSRNDARWPALARSGTT
jgi:hypothetical protein